MNHISHTWRDYQFATLSPGEWMSYCSTCLVRTERVSDRNQLLAKKLAAPPCPGDAFNFRIANEKTQLLDELGGLASCSECQADDIRVLNFNNAEICLCDRCIADAMRTRATAVGLESEWENCDQCKTTPPLPPLHFVRNHTSICDSCLSEALITRLSEVRTILQFARNHIADQMSQLIRDEREVHDGIPKEIL